MAFSNQFHSAVKAIDRENARADSELNKGAPANVLADAVGNDPDLGAALKFQDLQNEGEAGEVRGFFNLWEVSRREGWGVPAQGAKSVRTLGAGEVAAILGSANATDRRPIADAAESVKSETVRTAVALMVAAAVDPACRNRIGSPAALFARMLTNQKVQVERVSGFRVHFSELNGKLFNSSGGGNHRIMAASLFNRFALSEGARIGISPIEIPDVEVVEMAYDGRVVDAFFQDQAVFRCEHGGEWVKLTSSGVRRAPEGKRISKLGTDAGVDFRRDIVFVRRSTMSRAIDSLRPLGSIQHICEYLGILGASERKARRENLEDLHGRI